MKRSVLNGLFTLGLATVLLTGCAKAPQAEIDGANAAITTAQTAGADVYMKEGYIALTDSMKAVMAGIEEQNSKFFKNYSDAKAGLAGVTQMAAELTKQTQERIEALKVEIQGLIETVNQVNATNLELLGQAPKGKEGKAALEAIQSEIDMVSAAVSETIQLVDAAKYMDANTKILAAQEKANSINQELMEVIQKYQAKRR